jgi:hypothetical protein
MGAPALANPAAVTVSTTPIQVAAANPKRKWLIVQQTSANPVRVGGASVTATTGISLAQRGFVTFGDGKMECPTEAIFAVREGAADGTVNVLEFADT